MSTILINRAPVFTLWGAVVAEHLGYDPDEALSLARVMAGLTAQKKGRHLGIYQSKQAPGGTGEGRRAGRGEDLWIALCGRPVPARKMPEGIRGVQGAAPQDPSKARDYLEQKFGEHYRAAREAMEELASSFTREELEAHAYKLYELFRPDIPAGRAGWGVKGALDLELVRSMKKRAGAGASDG